MCGTSRQNAPPSLPQFHLFLPVLSDGNSGGGLDGRAEDVAATGTAAGIGDGADTPDAGFDGDGGSVCAGTAPFPGRSTTAAAVTAEGTLL